MAEEKELSDTQKDNYERLLFAIAVYFSSTLGVDIKKVESYKDLTEGQRTFARKILEKDKTLLKHADSTERLEESEIVKDISKVAQASGNAKQVRWVTVGDGKVCEKCAAWEGKVLYLDDSMSPNVSDAIRSGGLHPRCRCALMELGTQEIPLNPINPRYETRKAANPSVYHSAPRSQGLVFL